MLAHINRLPAPLLFQKTQISSITSHQQTLTSRTSLGQSSFRFVVAVFVSGAAQRLQRASLRPGQELGSARRTPNPYQAHHRPFARALLRDQKALHDRHQPRFYVFGSVAPVKRVLIHRAAETFAHAPGESHIPEGPHLLLIHPVSAVLGP